MKAAPALLLFACLGMVPAQAVNRCETGGGHVAYQDQACAQPVRADAAVEAPYDPEAQSPRRLLANAEAKAIALRMRAINGRADARRAVDRLQNVYRCREALQIVALCGSTAADFACDDRGFVAASGPAPPAVVGNAKRTQIQRCAMHASRGHAR